MVSDKQLSKYILEVDKLFDPAINYKNIPHKKLLVLFAGIPASGKSYIAAIVEAKLKAVRIRKDLIWQLAIQPLFEKTLDLADRNSILKAYIDFKLTESINLPNGLLILDKSVDRTYFAIQAWADKNNYKTFLIRVNSSIERAKENLVGRDGLDIAANYYRHYDNWQKDFEALKQKRKADFDVYPDKDFDSQMEDLVKRINALL